MAFSNPTRRRRRGRAPMAEINVTPLVDVMLVLLIIFMVTAPLLKAGVPLELPDSAAKAIGEEQDDVVISVTRDGTVALGEDVLAPGELPDRLAAIPRDAQGKPPLVTLRADKAIDYGRVMAVMGEINRAGFTSITLVSNAAPAASGVTAGSGVGGEALAP